MIFNEQTKSIPITKMMVWEAYKSQLPEQIRGGIYLPILQLMAFYRSLKKGLNPDTPKNLSAVVNLDL